MMTCSKIVPFLILIVLLVGVVSALPTTGAASGITSNNFTIGVAGASGPTFIWYGTQSGYPIWKSDNYTTAGGVVSIVVWGSPIMGGQTYYATACDSTGCGNQVSFSTLAITPVPTHGYDAGFNTIVVSHWNLMAITSAIIGAYTASIPTTIVFGIIFGFIIIGFWRQMRSVRLISILLMILSPLIMYPTTGLMLGMPGVMQSLGAMMFACGLAGILLSFIKK
jgi:hypothetical protein